MTQDSSQTQIARRSAAYIDATTLATLINSGGDFDDILAQWITLCASLSDLIDGD